MFKNCSDFDRKFVDPFLKFLRERFEEKKCQHFFLGNSFGFLRMIWNFQWDIKTYTRYIIIQWDDNINTYYYISFVLTLEKFMPVDPNKMDTDYLGCNVLCTFFSFWNFCMPTKDKNAFCIDFFFCTINYILFIRFVLLVYQVIRQDF